MIQTFDELDALDRSALLQWQQKRDSFTRPIVGDVVLFADTDMWNECSSGIHFYITRIEAENHV